MKTIKSLTSPIHSYTSKELSVYLFEDETFIDDISKYMLADDKTKISLIHHYQKNMNKALDFIQSSSFKLFSMYISPIYFDRLDRISHNNAPLKRDGEVADSLNWTNEYILSREIVGEAETLVRAVRNPSMFVDNMISKIGNNYSSEE